ncbi:MAG: amino acid adenylation domain-containing protein [Bacteroidota bacterium]
MNTKHNQVASLLSRAQQQGVFVFEREQKLKIRTDKNVQIDPSLLQEIKAYKADILEFLQDVPTAKKQGGKEEGIRSYDRSLYPRIPLSFSQEQLWLIDQMEGSVQYHVPQVLRLEGPLDVDALQAALLALVKRHEVFRTVFKTDGEETWQVLMPAEDWVMNYSEGAAFAEEAYTLDFMEKELKRPFDLSNDYMFRAHLIRCGKEEHVLILMVHHIASDGWSISILVKDLIHLYGAFATGEQPQLPALPIQYADYAIWQRTRLSKAGLMDQLKWWEEQLEDTAVLDLPTDFARQRGQRGAAEMIGVQIDQAQTEQLKALVLEQGATLFMGLLSLFKILLYRYTGQVDCCVGTPLANRQRKELEGLVGFFVNTLALRTDLGGNPSFRELLERVKTTTLAAYQHQAIPFDQIVKAVVKDRQLGHNPLFQVVFILQNTPEVPPLDLGPIRISPVLNERVGAKFELTVSTVEKAGQLELWIEYNSQLFKAETIKRMGDHYQKLLKQVLRNPQLPIDQLSLLTKEEEQQTLKTWNATDRPFPKNKNILQLFEQQVLTHPQRTALSFNGEGLTYDELNQRANQLAHILIQQGAEPQHLIAFCLDRSPELIISILAILKVGAAYVPIDPKYPEDRIQYMKSDSQCSICIDADFLNQHKKAIAVAPVINPSHQPAPIDPAYVIYTSGTTGRPKGVVVSHRNVVSLVKNNRFLELEATDVLLSTGSPSFDAATFEYWGILLNGGELQLCSETTLLDPILFKRAITLGGANKMWFTTGWFNELVEIDVTIFESLNCILVGGEKISVPHIAKVRAAYPKLTIIHCYGPTENTTFSLTYRIEEEVTENIPIGIPLSNRRAYVLNAAMQPCPVGIAGELWVGGSGVALSYLNDPDLTASRFVDNPFVAGDRLYRTGDLAYWLPDGNIEFLGRADHQVKIRGYRIELGEIEAQLQQSGMISRSVVLVKGEHKDSRRLLGYIVPKQNYQKASLQQFLRSKLPDYMLPEHYIELFELPLTRNGKIDRQALPEPDFSEVPTETYIAPRNASEAQLARIWQGLLKLEKVGIHHSFFELGGHSLLATRVVSAIRKEMNTEMAISDLFDYPTIAGLAKCIAEKEPSVGLPAIIREERPDQIPLSFAQERLWFIDKLQGSVHYHMPAVLHFHSAVERTLLEATFREMVNRHEVLRTIFVEEDGQAWQHILPKDQWQLEYVETPFELNAEELATHIKTEVNRPFDLTKDHTLRAQLLSTASEQYILILVLHHIASDGWSEAIFVEELKAIYTAQLKRQEARLPALPIQYADYALWQRRYLEGPVLAQQLAYWKQQLRGISVLDFPTDFIRPPRQSTKGNYLAFQVPTTLSQGLEQLAQVEGVTPFMLLLSAFKILLYRYSGQTDICVGSPIANRTQQAIEPLIGFFVNTLVLRSDLSGNPKFTDLLAQVKRTTLQAYAHQELPFEKIVDYLGASRDMSRSPIFQVMFAVQNNAAASTAPAEGLDFSFSASGFQASKFDFTFNITQTKEGLNVGVEYCVDLFTEASIERMVEHYQVLLEAVVNQPEQSIGQLEILSQEEREAQLIEYNDTASNDGDERSVLELFQDQVTQLSEHTALIFGAQRLDYKTLDQRSTQLAQYLRKQGVVQGQLIGLCVERSPKMIIAMLAILKAGAAYVPIDPTYPTERIRYILEDTQVPFVLTDSACEPLLPLVEEQALINLEKEQRQIEKEPITVLPKPESLEGPAVVIYTSGSTGRPKGVILSGYNISVFLKWALEEFANSNFEITYAGTSICFDISIFETFFTLCAGKKIRLLQSGLEITEYLSEDRAILINTVPSMMQSLIDQQTDLSNVNVINLAGEALPPAFRNQLDVDRIEVRNLYGPSEDTTYSTYFRIQKDVPVFIGRTTRDTQAYVLDEHQQLLPTGMLGELYLSGDQLSKGYLNRPELTAKKFIPHPFREGRRLYRTGDLVRWVNWEGTPYLAFIGRRDSQVKIRGYRIELGEIEHRIVQFEGVVAAVVLAKDRGASGKHLVAYITTEQPLEVEHLEHKLAEQLPRYMVPAIWMKLDAFPLNANGKINRKALPEPDFKTSAGSGYRAAETTLQKEIASIWQEVLGLDQVGITDNFFGIGGDSIVLIRVISRMEKQLGRSISVVHFYETPTILATTQYFEHNAAKDEAQAARRESIEEELKALREQVLAEHPDATQLVDVYPMSDIQKGMVFASQLNPGSGIYHDQFIYQLPMVEVDLFEKCLHLMTEKHSILRTAFDLHGYDKGLQLVYKSIEIKVDVQDLRGLSAEQQQARIQTYIAAEHQRPFDFGKAPLWRPSIFQLSESKMVYLLQFHHAILDGWSLALMNTELNELYVQLKANPDFQPAPIQSSNREAIVDHWVEKSNLAYADFWRKKMMGYKRLHIFSEQQQRDVYIKTYDQATLQSLKALAKAQQLSLKTLLFAAFAYTIKLLTREKELTVGMVSNLRPLREDGDKILGCFLNTLPVRLILEKEVLESWMTYLHTVDHQLKALSYGDRISLYEISRFCEEHSPNGNPFFDVLFNYTDFHVYEDLEISEEENETVEEERLELVGFGDTNTWLDTSIDITADGKLTVAFASKYQLQSGLDMQTLGQFFEHILEQLIHHNSSVIDHTLLLPASMNHQLLEHFHAPDERPAGKANLIDLFRQQVAQTPQRTALRFAGQRLSYHQVEQQSNQLAHYLLQQSHQSPRIALCLNRSQDILLGILAILKAGATYIPLNPSLPTERMDFLLRDTQADLVITHQEALKALPEQTEAKTIVLDQAWPSIQQQPDTPLKRIISDDQLAYIIYTSGSTGQPKGVLISHANLSMRLQSEAQLLGITPTVCTCLLTNYSFDVSLLELFLPLIKGGKVVIPTIEQIYAPKALLQLLAEEGVTLIQGTPSYIKSLMQALDPEQAASLQLQQCCIGGESLSDDLIQLIRKHLPQVKINNHYGPTETTIDALVFQDVQHFEQNIIGRPLPQTSAYIVDANDQLLPIGVVGELLIGGAGVASGYLNREDLTTSAFVPNPFDPKENSRLYRTGDLACWLPDGTVAFKGRKDEQVKIRGYRIELGEVETAIRRCAAIEQCIVLARTAADGNQQLIAYTLTADAVNKAEVMAQLGQQLPAYMVPAIWIEINELPLTTTGKIDHRALPDFSQQAQNYAAPQSNLEKQLAAIWEALLEVARVGKYDNFFALGGHSLMAMRAVAMIREQLQLEVAVSAFFTHPTLLQLATLLEQAPQLNQLPAIAPQPREGRLPLSFSQERLWFIDQLEGSVQYHMPTVLHLEGPLNRRALEQALWNIVERHEVLRTRLLSEDGRAYQEVMDAEGWTMEVRDISGMEEEAYQQLINTACQQVFDLSKDYMLRVHLLQQDVEQHLLLLVVHHIASDGWSGGILVEELLKGYRAGLAGQTPDLPPLVVQYADYALWQRQQLSAEVLAQQLNWWAERLHGLSPLNLPLDFPRPLSQSKRGALYHFHLDASVLHPLKALALAEGATLFMTLLAAFKVLLYRYSGQEDICVGTPISNREQRALEPLIGFFLNTLVLRTQLQRDQHFVELLQTVRDHTLAAYAHQQVPFEQIVERVEPTRDLSRSPLFQVLFVLHNTPEANNDLASDLGGLSISPGPYEHQTSQYDLSFSVNEYSDHLAVGIEYCSDLFTAETIERMASHFELLLQNIIEDTRQPISQLRLITAEEETQLLEQFNAPPIYYPKSETILPLLYQQAVEHPEQTALIAGAQGWTYRQIHERSNQLAYYLRKEGLGQGQLVGLCMDRSPDMIVAMLAILKAGGAYVPVDPTYPQERIDYIIKDADVRFVISSCNCQALFTEVVGMLLVLMEEEKYITEPMEALTLNCRPEQLAYVIYTSGSTGKPKGVAISHGNLNAFLHWSRAEFANSDFDIVYAVTSICFDLSIFEIFHTLSSGKCLRLLNNGLEIVEYLLEDEKILINTVPSVMSGLLDMEADLSRVNVINMAGEPIPLAIRDQLDLQRIEVRNLYGPSEDTTYSTLYRLQPDTPILIGRSIANTQAYILDDHQNLLPPGLIGELCLSGDQVTQGYLNRPELTAEKFIPNPFSTDPSARLYRTGDLARWTSTAELDFIGRKDTQVKVRGYRIELGEIEQALMKHAGVQQCVVLARDAGEDRHLVAYVQLEGEMDKKELQAALGRQLPSYMVPNFWIQLEQFPLTANGKINKRALPVLDNSVRSSPQFIAPQTVAERQLAAIWRAILQVDRVGVTDNFFELGGNSIKLVQLMAQIRKVLAVQVELRLLFSHPTIAGFLKASRTAEGSSSLLYPLNQASPEGITLICLPPILGLPLIYQSFANELEGAANVYGVQYQLLQANPDTEAPSAIAVLAQRLFDEVLSLCQHKESSSIYLLGFSFGAYVAFELTQLLEQAGITLQLMLVDAPYLAQASGEGQIKGLKIPPALQAAFEAAYSPAAQAAAHAGYLNNMRLLEQHVVSGAIQSPIIGLRGLPTDDTEQAVDMQPWQQTTSGDFQQLDVTGGHDELFVQHLQELVQLMRTLL